MTWMLKSHFSRSIWKIKENFNICNDIWVKIGLKLHNEHSLDDLNDSHFNETLETIYPKT